MKMKLGNAGTYSWFIVLTVLALLFEVSSEPAPVDTSVNLRRVKRSGGAIVAGGLVATGVIGASILAAVPHLKAEDNKGDGGCHWFGHSPFCEPNHCSATYEFVSMSGGWLDRIYGYDNSKNGNIMNKYGAQCTFFTEKRLCCKGNTGDCIWNGVWESVGSSVRISKLRRSYDNYPSGLVYCTFRTKSNTSRKCGMVICHSKELGESKSFVTGTDCNQVNLFGLKGKAHCGKIVWDIKLNGYHTTNLWYKVR